MWYCWNQKKIVQTIIEWGFWYLFWNNMLQNWFYLLLALGAVLSYPNLYETKKFKVGIEYDGKFSLIDKTYFLFFVFYTLHYRHSLEPFKKHSSL